MPTLRPALPALAGLALCAATGGAQSAPANVASVPPGFRGEFLSQFDNSMAKLVALASAIPPDKYTWRPAAGVMPVAQVYAHVARFNYHYPATAMDIATPPGIALDTLERMTDKAQVIALLRQSAEHVRQRVRQMPEAQLARRTTLYDRQVPQWAVLFQLVAHMNEHVGQSIAYARSNGIVPPWSQ